MPEREGSRRLPPFKKGQQTYAQMLGARPASKEEKAAAVQRGWLRNPNTRAYTLPNGRVVSNRAMQQAASHFRYGETLTLEQRRAQLEQAGYRSGPAVKSNWVNAVRKNVKDFRGMSYREVERNPRFQQIWEQWQYLRGKHVGDADNKGIHRNGKWWADKRFSFLRRYGVLHWESGKWVS